MDQIDKIMVSMKKLFFSKEFFRFLKEDLIHLYSLMRFPGTVRLENQSVLSCEEFFYEDCLNWPLVIRRPLLRRLLVAIPLINKYLNILSIIFSIIFMD